NAARWVKPGTSNSRRTPSALATATDLPSGANETALTAQGDFHPATSSGRLGSFVASGGGSAFQAAISLATSHTRTLSLLAAVASTLPPPPNDAGVRLFPWTIALRLPLAVSQTHTSPVASDEASSLPSGLNETSRIHALVLSMVCTGLPVAASHSR